MNSPYNESTKELFVNTLSQRGNIKIWKISARLHKKNPVVQTLGLR